MVTMPWCSATKPAIMWRPSLWLWGGDQSTGLTCKSHMLVYTGWDNFMHPLAESLLKADNLQIECFAVVQYVARCGGAWEVGKQVYVDWPLLMLSISRLCRRKGKNNNNFQILFLSAELNLYGVLEKICPPGCILPSQAGWMLLYWKKLRFLMADILCQEQASKEYQNSIRRIARWVNKVIGKLDLTPSDSALALVLVATLQRRARR